MQSLRGRIPLAILLGILIPQARLWLDAPYWNLRYSTQSTPLGGAVIGNVADLSATYYNPGRLGLRKDPGLIPSLDRTTDFSYCKERVLRNTGRVFEFLPLLLIGVALTPRAWTCSGLAHLSQCLVSRI